jgi:multidrug transporter EmrE-like cation transporter
MKILLLSLISVALSVSAQFSLKSGMSNAAVKLAMAQPYGLNTLVAVFSNLQVLLGFFLYGMGAIVWLGVLAKWDVSKAYPIVGLGFVLTVLVGFVLGEQVSLMRVIGVAVICLGVVLVAQS